jgi:hypothetical protein
MKEREGRIIEVRQLLVFIYAIIRMVSCEHVLTHPLLATVGMCLCVIN